VPKGESCFEEATERFRELAGDQVRIEFGPRSEDRYDRALFYVYTEAGESVAEKLIREGLGKAWGLFGYSEGGRSGSCGAIRSPKMSARYNLGSIHGNRL